MESPWQTLIPDSLLFDIFSYLDLKTLGRAGRVCTRWYRIEKDELLWQQLARRIWKIKGGLAPGKSSWYGEVKRLRYHVPIICSETIEKHTDEVLDVSISHSGQYFCTCSKDALVIMWELGNRMHSNIVKSFDASIYLKWQLSQYSIFCPDDSLILVCGVKSYDEIPLDVITEYKAGVGAVFTVPDLNVVTVVEMDPPTMFGAWLNERVFLGGWPGPSASTVDIQAYMVPQHQISNPIIAPNGSDVIFPEDYRNLTDFTYDRNGYRLFSFHGSRYHLMNLLVANVPMCQCCSSGSCDMSGSCDIRAGKQCRKRSPQPDESLDVPEARKVKIKDSTNNADFSDSDGELTMDYSDCSINFERSCDNLAAESSSCNGREQCDMQVSKSSSSSLQSCKTCETSNSCKPFSSSRYCDKEMGKRSDESVNELSDLSKRRHSSNVGIFKNPSAKCIYKQYVAFVTGSHDVIGMHEVTQEHLKSVLEDERNQGSENETMEGTQPRKDKIDYTFHLKDCYITGLCLSQDQRFLYFNFREMDKAAPENKVDDPDDELPVAEKVFCKDLKIGSIDLVAMEMVKDIEFSGHVGYSSFPAWYICLDACPDYIGSGSEDMRGYIWDRHYGVHICRLFHSTLDTGENTLLVMSMHENSVVNGLAFSPVDQETCITVCDDRLIKVWRSKHKMKSLLVTEMTQRVREKLKMKYETKVKKKVQEMEADVKSMDDSHR